MRKLGELSKEELHELLEKNNDFKAEVYEWAYQAQMDLQREEFELMGADKFDYHDHYSSFYLTCPKSYGVKDGKSLRGELDEDYMTEEMKPLYKKLCENADKMDWLEYQCEEYCKLDEECDDIADKLAELYTDILRSYEDVSDEQIDWELEQIAEGMRWASGWETDGTIVYQHITKEYK